jgi:hypothetical protein
MADKLKLSSLVLLAHRDFDKACGDCGQGELMVERVNGSPMLLLFLEERPRRMNK